MSKRKPPITYRDLLDKISALTPEQLAMPVLWCGENRGGPVQGIWILEEDQINPSGDGWEPVSLVRRELIESERMTEAEADKEIAGEEVVGVKGQVVLLTDEWEADQAPQGQSS